jgi:hypothetical protein
MLRFVSHRTLMHIAFAVMLLFSTRSSFSQVSDIKVIASPEIENMVARHQQINREEGVLSGYRIQIFASPILAKSREAQNSCLMSNPDFSTQIVLEEPDFKVLVGYYLNRLDANADFQRVVTQYPGAFLVRQLIPISDL